MARKETTVVINGKEYVSKAAEEAAQGMDNFVKKGGGWINSLADLKAGWDLISGAVSRAWNIVKDSIAAYDEAAASNRKLEGTAKLTGVALEDLKAIALVGRNAFQLSSVTANDFAAEIAKLVVKAGQTDKAAESLAAFLNIGAARGLSAAETLKAVQQAILGIDEGTDKLFNKNPSVIYEEFAAKIGTTAGKLTDQQKAQALLNEALEGGIKTLGEYEKYLDSSAGKAERFAERNREAAAEFGKSFDSLRGSFFDVGSNVVPWFYDVWRRNIDDLVGTLKTLESALFTVWSATAKLLGDTDTAKKWGERAAAAAAEAEKANRRASQSAKDLAEENKQLSGSFLDVVKQTAPMQQTFTGMLKPLGETKTLFAQNAQAVGNIGPRANMTAKEIESYGKMSVKTAKEVAEAHKKEEQEWKRKYDLYVSTFRLVQEHTLKYKEIVEKLDPVIRKGFDKATVGNFSAALDVTRQNADDLIAKMKEIGLEPVSAMDKISFKIREAGFDLAASARTTLDLAQGFGEIDRESAAALGSIINVGQAIGKMATGNPIAGVAGIIGGVANIVSVMMQGDKERRELTRENNAQLRKINTEGLKLSNKATGQQIAGIQNALTPQQIADLAKLTTSTGRDVGNQMLVKLLAEKGLRLSDLDAVANELGMKIRRDNGQIELSQLPLLFQALQQNGGQLTRIGQTFGEQYAFLREKQRLEGATGLSEVQGVLAYLTSTNANVRALRGLDLSNTAAARNQLLDMLTGLNNNVFTAADLGNLTGQEFKTVLVELIGLLDNLKDQAPVNAAPPTTTTDDVVTTTAGVTMSVQSVQEVIEAMHTGVEGVLKEHTGYHQRIADATEGSYGELQQVNRHLVDLIAATAGSIARIDRELGEARLIAVANAGRGPEF